MNPLTRIMVATGVALVAASGIVLWVLAEWTLVDRFPSAVYMEFTGIVWMVFFLLATVSFVALYELPDAGPIALLPITIQVAGVLVVFYAPLDRLWIEANFRYYKSEREAVVDQVASGRLVANVEGRRGMVALDDRWSRISAGGNEIVIDERGDDRFIFFYTYRGGRDNYAGFIHVPEGLAPRDSGLGPRQLEEVLPMGDGWYHVSPLRHQSP